MRFVINQKNTRNMKKIVLIASFLLAFVGVNFAQTTPAKPAKKAKTAKTTTVATAKPATTTTAGPTKKDGTADMRYKANKDAAKTPPAHLKADGTPDKRFKENKTKKTN
jgi:hypothetical protein